jgi:hypothetical protein
MLKKISLLDGKTIATVELSGDSYAECEDRQLEITFTDGAMLNFTVSGKHGSPLEAECAIYRNLEDEKPMKVIRK